MPKKRRHDRPRSPHRINVLAASDERILGRLVDISIGGLMFLTQGAFRVGTLLQLRLPLPSMAGSKPAIEVQGEVVWTTPDSHPSYHRVGVEFEALGAEEAYIIETVLQRMHLVG
jgi:Tfp pilus assembly protein PilZ